jgi:glycerophosphoryl diester phosphodiesterase
MRQFSIVWVSFITILLLGCSISSNFNKIGNELQNPKSDYVMVAAHRCAHNGYPENSLSALKNAIKLGVDIAETDVKVTKDSVVVLMHDRKIDRTTNGKGNPENFTLAELKKFRLKMPDGTLTDETIPTFEEFLNIAKGHILVDIDIKTSHLKPVVDLVKRTGTTSQVFFFDNDYDALKEVLEMEPKALMMPRAYSYQMADSALKIFDAVIVHIDNSFYNKDVSDLIKGNNARIWINALDEADSKIREGKINEGVEPLLKYGANIIQTDEPEKIIKYLKSKGLRK